MRPAWFRDTSPWLLCVLFLTLYSSQAAAQAAETPLLAALQHAAHQDAPYRQAVYVYLRLAGLFWIAVEWIAAVLLWRGYRLLAAAARRLEEKR